MKVDGQEIGFNSEAFAPPSLVSLSPFPPAISPSPRRLSSSFVPPKRPIKAARQLAWVSLQGRLVGAEEASSARAIAGGLSPEQAVSWELFSPIQRVLIVAIIAVAAGNSKKNKQILQLTKSVELRDQVLLAMQQKLDNLCEQVNYFKDQPYTVPDISSTKNVELQFNESFSGELKNDACGCRLCDYHQPPSNDLMGNAVVEASKGEDTFKYNLSLINVAEPEERRMSDLSDLASSVTSSIDIQMESLSIGQDIFNLRKECQEKDATIKELSACLHSSEVVGTKRIAELKDVIRRKNMIITKLQKDMFILEQKVLHLTRLRRSSFSVSGSSSNSSPSLRHPPVMTDNLLYDMESTTSSSDSDYPSRNRHQTPVALSLEIIPVQKKSCSSMGDHKMRQARSSNLLVKTLKSAERQESPLEASPLKEKSLNQKPDSGSFSRLKQSLSADGDLKSRRRAPTRSKDPVTQKKWV